LTNAGWRLSIKVREKQMDLTHVFLIGMLVISIAVPVVGFWLMLRRQERDEAIDAAIFLAHRQLDEYVKRNK
jgi:hypothetical protein